VEGTNGRSGEEKETQAGATRVLFVVKPFVLNFFFSLLDHNLREAIL